MPTGQQARPWLYGVAREVLGNVRRAERRRAGLAQRLAVSAHPERRHVTATDAERVTLAAAWRSLSTRDRDLLSLVSWHTADPTELGRLLGCSRRAAVMRLSRARSRLDTALDAHDPR